MKYEVTIGNHEMQLEFDTDRSVVDIDGTKHEYTFEQQGDGRRLLRIGTKLYKIDNVSYEKHTVEFTLDGEWCKVQVRDEQDLLLDHMGFKTAAELGEGQLFAPMPGKILQVNVKEGDEVEQGEPVAILEAMKMENELKAPMAGVVSTVAVAKGDSLEKNGLILEIEASG